MRLFRFNLILVAILIASSALALRPEDLALVVNKNEPQGVALAEIYAKARGVPGGRIIELDLPIADDVSFQQYETSVVPAVREFLIKHQLVRQVRCLVTFYGVPLRVAARENTPADNAEVESLRSELRSLTVQMEKTVARLEEQAKGLDPNFRPMQGQDVNGILRRAEFTRQFIGQHLNAIADPRKREKFVLDVNKIAQQLLIRMTGPTTTQPNPQTVPALLEEMSSLEAQRFDGGARARIREIARQLLGLMPYARLVDTQLGYLLPDDTQAAFDSELALVLWPLYSRVRWQINPLHFRVSERTPPVLMVSRLDAEKPEVVREMIAASVEIEQQGLNGKVLVDTWAKNSQRPDGTDDDYTRYDKALRSFGTIAREKTKLSVVVDEKPELVPPGSVKDIAVYCGWYSPNEFISPGSFSKGAVGAHIASYTLTALHTPSTGDWARQLLNAGVVASFGAVSEPYLHSFPNPDEFFPLILTGKLTLAEAYWKTNPLASWRIALVGDPLYTPFKQDPAIAVSDLPPNLRGIFSDASTTAAAAQAPRPDGR